MAADKLSPFKFYQYLLTNTTDADVIKFLKMLTFVSLEDIAALEAHMAEPGYRPNTAQRLLAQEVTRFVHGPEGLQQAEEATQVRSSSSLSKRTAAYAYRVQGQSLTSCTCMNLRVCMASGKSLILVCG